VNCLKNNFNIYIKINIKTAPTCFGVTVTPSSGSALLYYYILYYILYHYNYFRLLYKKEQAKIELNVSGNTQKVQKNAYTYKLNSEEHSRFTQILRLCRDILLVCCPANLCKVLKDRGKDSVDRRDT
jgi:hypothetical protein